MAIFLDTGKIEEIEKFMKMGILRGVTTNPTILLKSGVTGGEEAIKKDQLKLQILLSLTPYQLKLLQMNLRR